MAASEVPAALLGTVASCGEERPEAQVGQLLKGREASGGSLEQGPWGQNLRAGVAGPSTWAPGLQEDRLLGSQLPSRAWLSDTPVRPPQIYTCPGGPRGR